MAVHIKKIIRDAVGNILEEIEGTEAEIEAYEKKQGKRQKALEELKKKKEVLLGKMAEADLRKLIAEEIAKQPHYHYHYQYTYPQYSPYLGQQYTIGLSSVTNVTGSALSIASNGVKIGNSSLLCDGAITAAQVNAGNIRVSTESIKTSNYQEPTKTWSNWAPAVYAHEPVKE
jgi:hypothetical protein